MTPLMLGTPVACKSRAWIARKMIGYDGKPTDKWIIPNRGNLAVPHFTRSGDTGMRLYSGQPIEHVRPITDRTNKSVVKAEIAGSGIIIGLERKMVGVTTASKYEDDCGYFHNEGHVDLYVVKSDLKSKPIYVPMDDVVPLAPYQEVAA